MNSQNPKIVIDPKVQHGKPLIRGTRVPVSRVVAGLAGGMTFQEVQDAYGIAAEDVRAALEYASQLVEQEEHHALPA